jgi:hypothetical protein
MNIQIGQLWQSVRDKRIVIEIINVDYDVPPRYFCRRLDDDYEAWLRYQTIEKYWQHVSGPKP